ncbi:hypothetical protein [Paraburkholderia hospita]|uniref:hypothetical protein n=1 Tax=Paraburkholderia hospita TaxID=169430 RepID=UPI0005877D8F|nr:hypothetical protein [Paraburkholderia hospita]OUL80679.1 hypothetical protein CA602_27355 [Paraburkholderia hospita]OUL96397.1 hypothetical protein CA601_02885 [Paraburkholderia hospita]
MMDLLVQRIAAAVLTMVILFVDAQDRRINLRETDSPACVPQGWNGAEVLHVHFQKRREIWRVEDDWREKT